MTNVIARTKTGGKHFEILVDVDKALEFKKSGKGSIGEVLAVDAIFVDSKKGMHAGEKDLKEAFGTNDINFVAEKIVKTGEIQLPTEYKEKQREGKEKQIVEFIVRNAVDPRTDHAAHRRPPPRRPRYPPDAPAHRGWHRSPHGSNAPARPEGCVAIAGRHRTPLPVQRGHR